MLLLLLRLLKRLLILEQQTARSKMQTYVYQFYMLECFFCSEFMATGATVQSVLPT